MSIEQKQHETARSALQKILREPSLPFGMPLLTEQQATRVMQGVELLIETRMAVREREILEAIGAMLDERS